ncbi:MAG TPA: prepilin-type N-terminal cleavage/methylation domain-containing protein [Candidatus Omnitrophota bacterium]|nr:prepilin-type N-terminal cleavage/methylation domain-containing protein [Candidatus Omnitrophota bacterium]HSA30608.1 prepilin-type N-terminal cleavage/methylation domain-containing protein [Candidatus Omnitrophota bacterium]
MFRKFRSVQGLTLVELLLGLSIFSVMAVSLYLIFQNGIMISRRAQRYSTLDGEMFFSMELMARDLENMVSYTDRAAGEGSLKGNGEEISMIVTERDGLKEVRYFLVPPEKSALSGVAALWEDGPQKPGAGTRPRPMILVREVSDFPCQKRPCRDETTVQEIISAHVVTGGLKFMYATVRTDDDGDGLRWDPQWSELSAPLGVEILMDFLDPDGGLIYTMEKKMLVPSGIFTSPDREDKK